MSAEERLYLARLEEENKLRAKLLAMNPLGSLPVTLPGEVLPRTINYGDDLEQEYEEISRIPADQFSHTSAWMFGKDGKMHLTMLLPGEKMGAAFNAHLGKHREPGHDHRLNSAMVQITPNVQGGNPSMTYDASISTPYASTNGPYRMNVVAQENGAVQAVYGTRAANDLFRQSSELAQRKVLMGCPIVSHADIEQHIPKKRKTMEGTIAHIKKMKGSFVPLAYNQGSLENPSMLLIKQPSVGMSDLEAADHMARNIPGLSEADASRIVAGIRTQYTARFGNAIPPAAVFTAHESEIYHPNTAYVNPTSGGFEHAAAKDASGKEVQYALTDKQAHLFGSGFAYRYGAPSHKNHVFQNVYTTIAPQGVPIDSRPVLSTSWYPSAADPEAYVIQPSHAPFIPPKIAISTPVGNTGQAFLI